MAIALKPGTLAEGRGTYPGATLLVMHQGGRRTGEFTVRYQTALEPVCTHSEGSIELFIRPRERDLGEFTLRRVLPATQSRMVGPFVFFDHMGPAFTHYPAADVPELRPPGTRLQTGVMAGT